MTYDIMDFNLIGTSVFSSHSSYYTFFIPLYRPIALALY